MFLSKRNRPKRNRSTAERGAAESRWRLPKLPKIDANRAGSALALAVALPALLWVTVRALDRPVQFVDVQGKFQRVSPVQVEQVVAPFGTSGFISVDLDKVKRSVAALPWVDRVRVERAWPNGLRVVVTEHTPAARWGESGLLNTRGELFLTDVRNVPEELPRLNGPLGTETEVAKLYLATYPRLLSVGMALTNVTLDPRGAWDLGLAHGVDVRLGRQDVQGRLERFISVASPVVAPRLNEINYIDMRYSNGFAIGWTPVAARPAVTKEESTPDA